MWRRSVLTSGILVALMAFAVLSQERRGPGGGGFGGFRPGGPGGPGGMPGGSAMVLGMPEVQQELGITDAQKKQVDEWLGDFQEQMRASFSGVNFQELQELTDEQRDKRFAEMREKSEAATKKSEEKLSKILDATQNKRLIQLRLQLDGVLALDRPEISSQLKLTDDQRDKLRKTIEEGMSRFSPPEQRQKAQADAVAILTDDQRTKWTAMKGTEFKFPEQRGFGPGGPGGFGPGGPGGPMGGGERKLVKEFDKDGDGMLNNAERQVARKSLQNPGGGGRRGGPGFGPPGGFGGRENQEPAKPGPHVSPADVKAHPDAPLYEPNVLRTFFLEFENKDWETELSDFHGTDVEIPATLTVDGKKYPNVGIHFRGMSSYMMVSAGYKRSMNLSLDFVDSKQRLYGYKTLNLLNSHEDASFLSTVLYSEIARKHIPAPKANFVKLVINGESWGVYVNTQQFNKDFLAENYPSTKGTRWKVRGSPGGGGGLEYIGDNIEDYKRRYEMKTEDGDKVWREFIKLCRTLNETPADRLEESLKPMLDIDGVLWFLALDVALINNDGYWVRASDYSIYRDAKGVFHIIPHDMNEAFHGAMGFGFGGPGGPGGGFGPPGGGPGGFGRPGGGPRDQSAPRGEGAPRAEGQPRGQDGPRGPGGRGMGPGGGGGAGVELDPLVALDDPRKPLRSKLLAVPSLKARYLEHVRTIAEESLDWKKLQPVVEQYASLIEEELEADTRKLTSLDAFKQSVSDKTEPATEGRRRQTNLRTFVESRRNYLLSHPEIKKVVSTPTK